MFLSKNRRTRVFAAALLAALLIPLATASADFFWAERSNGAAMNGYYMTPSAQGAVVDSIFYDSLLRQSAQKWKSISTRVTPGIFEYPEWVPGCDKYYVQPVLRIKHKEEKRLLGRTRYYGTTPDPDIRNLSTYYPDAIDGINVHGSRIATEICGHDRPLEMATVTLYTTPIRENANRLQVPIQSLAQLTAVHEIGHTLKLAHSQFLNGDMKGDGTKSLNDDYRTGETRSVMEKEPKLPLQTSPQLYDKRQLVGKWGQ